MIEKQALELCIQTIKDAELVEVVEINGRSYTKEHLHDATPLEFKPDLLELTSLQGLVDYLALDLDRLANDNAVVHVVSPARVVVTTGVTGERRERLYFAIASVQQLAVDDKWLPPDTMTVRLRTRCAPGGSLDEVVRVLGCVTAEESVKVKDDGFSQEVSQRRGLTLVGKETVPNPVELAPYRTFREVEQPSSPFLLRVKGGGEEPISCCLFEADGGAWKIAAVAAVVEWLQGKNLPLQIIS